MLLQKKLMIWFLFFMVLLGGLQASQQGVQQTDQSKKSKLININLASVEELSTLPRIGVKIAQRIVEYRKKNGNFKKIQEIMRVKGIGEKLFEKIKNQITV